MWLLRNIKTLQSGRWPVQDNMPENIGDKQFKNEGPFVKAIVICSELCQRLDKCGVAGKLLAAQARASESLDLLELEAWEALMYVKGWRRKETDFLAWRRKRRYREKGTKVFPQVGV